MLISSACGSSDAGGWTTVRVTKGTVARTVSATGTLQAITEQNLGFSKGGKLTALMVAVGQQVKAGQVLAKVDDFDAQSDLQEAKAKLSRQEAVLARLEDSNKTDAAEDDYDRAKDVLGATKDEADVLSSVNDDSLKQTQQQLDDDRDKLKKIQAVAKADQDKCNRSLTGGSHRYDGYGDNADVTTKNQKGLLLESPLDLHSPSCDRAERGKATIASYQRRIDSGKRSIQRLQRQQDIQDARQKVAVENARRDADAAGNAADGAASDHPHDLDEQQAIVEDAATDVRRAQHAVDNTVLIAPVSGKVASINGAVGEYIGSGGGSTALAPGSRTALPNTDSGVSSHGDSGDKSDRPGDGSFMTLKDVNSFSVVVPFEESDATLVQPNQRVNVTFDAVPGLSAPGTVASIAPTGTQIKDVNNYYATIVLNAVDPRLKGGQTAEAKVIVGGVSNVLVVPTAAIQRGGTNGVVQVMQPDGTTRRVQVQLGLVGDTTTQIVGGLTEGQQVAISQS
ncbi:efflux RND transporter periplasmic adaptor subunit [Pseudonocardia spinosispora]|uniref:efflux RND transporter periplasmic adaptor subunit n=1 Tax=Pseudonocardia spinosispora TaxID=103441 RepID=UPI000418158C|nr:biotin/lipoyl-binding protein [Pseudonocardia spinosispora]